MHPILLRLGPITIYSYGFMLAVAFIVATMLAQQKARQFGVNPEKILELAIFIMLFGIIGARIAYVLLNLQDFVKRPFEIFYLHKGGLVFYGGAIFGGVASLFFIKRNKLNGPDLADLIAPYAALGQSIGRIGCLLNGCCWGKPTDLAWAIVLPQQEGTLHPTQAYESLGVLVIFLILVILQDKRVFRGQIFGLYLLFYSMLRFFIEFLRGDNTIVFFSLTFSQIASVIIFIISLFFYIKMSKDAKSQI